VTFQEFLQYVQTSAGINAVIGFILSFVAEWIPGYDVLEAKLKRLIMMLLCFVLPIVATVLLGCYESECIWQALLAGGAAFFGSQASHLRKL